MSLLPGSIASAALGEPERTGRRAKRRPERRTEILEAAVRLFYEKGYSATSMIEIAAELGMSGSSIYRHFESKQDLLEIAIRESAMTHVSELRSHLLAVDPILRADAILRAFIQINITDRALTGVVWRESHHLSTETQQWVNAETKKFAHEWAATLRKARPELSKDQALLLIRSAMRICQAAFHSPEWTEIADVPTLLLPVMRNVVATRF